MIIAASTFRQCDARSDPLDAAEILQVTGYEAIFGRSEGAGSMENRRLSTHDRQPSTLARRCG